jgi:dynein heavy chain
VRFGVMLVGANNSGKTVVFEILKHAMSALKDLKKDAKFQTVHTYIMNPKSISMGELYGEVSSM